MNDKPNSGELRNEMLDQRIYAQLASQCWRLPQSEREVELAEEPRASDPTRLPDRLAALPGEDRSRAPSGLLERYLRDDGRGRSDDGAKSMDGEKPDRDLDR